VYIFCSLALSISDEGMTISLCCVLFTKDKPYQCTIYTSHRIRFTPCVLIPPINNAPDKRIYSSVFCLPWRPIWIPRKSKASAKTRNFWHFPFVSYLSLSVILKYSNKWWHNAWFWGKLASELKSDRFSLSPN